jgi:hypothetical protein
LPRNALTDVTVTRRRLCITSHFCKITKVLEPTLYFPILPPNCLGLCIVVRTAIAIVYRVMRHVGSDQDLAAFMEKTVARRKAATTLVSQPFRSLHAAWYILGDKPREAGLLGPFDLTDESSSIAYSLHHRRLCSKTCLSVTREEAILHQYDARHLLDGYS